jgi:hypothetical protein
MPEGFLINAAVTHRAFGQNPRYFKNVVWQRSGQNCTLCKLFSPSAAPTCPFHQAGEAGRREHAFRLQTVTILGMPTLL